MKKKNQKKTSKSQSESLVKWNTKKKEERDQKQAHQKAKALVGKVYTAWKNDFVNRPQTQDDIVASLKNLKERVVEACNVEGMETYRDFTVQMLDEKITHLLSNQLSTHNEVREILPESSKEMPHRARFTTKEEFEEIPFIKTVREKPGFVGFIRAYPNLFALFPNGELVPVAEITNDTGLRSYPTLQEMQNALAKLPEPPEALEQN